MWTFRNVAALGIGLFGTTFLWLLPSFGDVERAPSGGVWTAIQVTVFALVLGLAGSAWGLYRQHAWWSTLTLVCAAAGLVLVAVWVRAARDAGSFPDLASNAAIHGLGSALLLALVALPPLSRWFADRL